MSICSLATQHKPHRSATVWSVLDSILSIDLLTDHQNTQHHLNAQQSYDRSSNISLLLINLVPADIGLTKPLVPRNFKLVCSTTWRYFDLITVVRTSRMSITNLVPPISRPLGLLGNRAIGPSGFNIALFNLRSDMEPYLHNHVTRLIKLTGPSSSPSHRPVGTFNHTPSKFLQDSVSDVPIYYVVQSFHDTWHMMWHWFPATTFLLCPACYQHGLLPNVLCYVPVVVALTWQLMWHWSYPTRALSYRPTSFSTFNIVLAILSDPVLEPCCPEFHPPWWCGK
jgi:hypothetical protein